MSTAYQIDSGRWLRPLEGPMCGPWHILVTGPDDESVQYIQPYSIACSACYLGHPHSADYHNARTQEEKEATPTP